MTFEIEAATTDDIDEVNELFAENDAHHRHLEPEMFRPRDGSQPPRSAERLTDLIQSGTAGLFVARAGDQIVGLASVSLTERKDHPIFVDRKFAVVEDLVVRKDHRRRGIGTALARHAGLWATSAGATTIELGVWSSNDGARRFYERLGYVSRSVKMTLELV